MRRESKGEERLVSCCGGGDVGGGDGGGFRERNGEGIGICKCVEKSDVRTRHAFV